MTPSKLMKLVEAYRTAGGREEHHAYKEELMRVFEEHFTVEPMTQVADLHAHKLALMLECVLSGAPPSQRFYNEALSALGEYRSAMNAIHEQHSPTFLGEPVLHTKA